MPVGFKNCPKCARSGQELKVKNIRPRGVVDQLNAGAMLI